MDEMTRRVAMKSGFVMAATLAGAGVGAKAWAAAAAAGPGQGAGPGTGRGRGPEAGSAGGAVLELPRPTGMHAIGATELYLVDPSRSDPWDPTIPVRELMITITYPAATIDGFPLAPQMLPHAAAAFGIV